jgi:hypothetical protein
MNFSTYVWTKADREPFVEDYMRRVDTVEDYIENLVGVWHEAETNFNIAGETVQLYDFLGLEEHEISTWVKDGFVSHRILSMWLRDEY